MALATVFMFSNGFSVDDTVQLKSEENLDHSCNFNMRNSRGELMGVVVVLGVPDNVACNHWSVIYTANVIWSSRRSASIQG